MHKKTAMQAAVILCPVGSLLIAGGVIAGGRAHVNALDADDRTVRQQIASARQLLAELEGQQHLVRFPTAAQVAQEQPVFLNQLRSYADLNRVRIDRWTISATTINPRSAQAQKKGLPPDVTPLTSSLQVAGRYADVRLFLYDLLRSPRLVNMSDIRWTRAPTPGDTALIFTITRYVAPPGKASADVNAAVAALPGNSFAMPAGGPTPPETTNDAVVFKRGSIGMPSPEAAAAARRILPSSAKGLGDDH
jgi:Tfp pilus assembly protein PilO